jgi:phage baseplate assembly protein V
VRDVQQLVARMLEPVGRRIRLMVARAVVTAIADAGKIQSAQVKLLDGEVRDAVEILHQYGFTSIPHGQPEGLYFSVGGDRDHGVMICVADRQFRLKNIAPGEVALYDDLGQKVHLTRGGIVVDGAGLPIAVQNTPVVTVTADTKVSLVTPLVETTGDLHVAGNIHSALSIVADGEISDQGGTKSMSGMRGVFNGHDHHENNAANGNTNQPNQQM